MLLAELLPIFVSAFCLAISSVSACGIPPAFWCDTPETRQACNVNEQCSQYDKEAGNTQVTVTVIYDSMSADSYQYFQSVLLEVWNNAKDIVSLQLLPFGTAEETNGKVDCLRGPEECRLNFLHACAIEKTSRKPEHYLPFVVCLLEQATIHNVLNPDVAAKHCYDAVNMKSDVQKVIDSCRSNAAMQKTLEERMLKVVRSVQPAALTSVPWILINNISTLKMQSLKNYLGALVCTEAYRGNKRPDTCTKFDFMRPHQLR